MANQTASFSAIFVNELWFHLISTCAVVIQVVAPVTVVMGTAVMASTLTVGLVAHVEQEVRITYCARIAENGIQIKRRKNNT